MTDPGRSNVLVTDGGNGQGRSALAAVRALGRSGHRVAVTVSTSGPSLAASSRWCAEAVPVPRADATGYAEAVTDAAERRNAEVVAASDGALLALGADVRRFVDKQRLAEVATAAGLATPQGRVALGRDAVRDLIEDIGLPAVVKPLVSRLPAVRVDEPSQIDALVLDDAVIVQPWVEGPMRAVAGVVHEGRLLAVCHQRYLRTWPVDCGTAAAAVTTERDLQVEERLLHLLDGFDGVFQAQFRGAYLLDVNPRVYGSLPLSVAAGADLASIEMAARVGRVGEPVAARPDVAYRWIEGDVRHVFSAWRRRRLGTAAAVRALLPRAGTVHSVVMLADPAPTLARLRHVASTGRG